MTGGAAITLGEAQPGDFILCHDTGVVAAAIRLGQRLRVPKAFCTWNHAAILSGQGADGAWWVIEAEGHGVEHNLLDVPGRGEYQVVASGVAEEHRALVVRFAVDQIGHHYGWLTILSIVLDLLTPSRLNLQRAGTWICSALTARSIEHGGRMFDGVSPFEITPAQLAQTYGVGSP